MILNHINYKMPIYKDCTFGELMFVGGCTFLILSTTLSLLTKLLFGIAGVGLAIAFLVLVHTTRFLLGRLQKVKYGKPYGFYRQLLLKKVANNFNLKLPFVIREGKWSVRR